MSINNYLTQEQIDQIMDLVAEGMARSLRDGNNNAVMDDLALINMVETLFKCSQLYPIDGKAWCDHLTDALKRIKINMTFLSEDEFKAEIAQLSVKGGIDTIAAEKDASGDDSDDIPPKNKLH